MIVDANPLTTPTSNDPTSITCSNVNNNILIVDHVRFATKSKPVDSTDRLVQTSSRHNQPDTELPSTPPPLLTGCKSVDEDCVSVQTPSTKPFIGTLNGPNSDPLKSVAPKRPLIGKVESKTGFSRLLDDLSVESAASSAPVASFFLDTTIIATSLPSASLPPPPLAAFIKRDPSSPLPSSSLPQPNPKSLSPLILALSSPSLSSLSRSPPPKSLAASTSSPSSLTKYLPEYNLEERVILLPSSSSSISISEDHLNYCSARPSLPTSNLKLSKANNCSTITSTTTTTSTIAVLLNSDSKVDLSSTTSLSLSSSSPNNSSVPNKACLTKARRHRLPAKSAVNSNATITTKPTQNPRQFQTSNECFKQFFLQPQPNGTFVIVPYSVNSAATSSAGARGAKSSKSQTTTKSKVSPLATNQQQETSAASPAICLNDDIQLKQANAINEAQIMQIGNLKCDNSNLADTRQDFSLMEIFQPTKLSNNHNINGKKMANKPHQTSPFYGQLTNDGNNYQYSQQLQQQNQKQQQTRAIISALKHDHPIPPMSSSSSFLNISSSPPVVSSSSSSSSSTHKQLSKADDITNEMYSSFGSSSFGSNGGSNLLEQNMLVASLPPVETIFNDRSISLSMASIQQQQQQQSLNDDADLNIGNSFEPTTIINDHHIDYYGQVDSTVDDDEELLLNSKCLPFGYFYNDDLVFNELKKISSLPSSTTSSPVLDGFNSINDLFDCGATDKTEGVYNENFIAFPSDGEYEFTNGHPNSSLNCSRAMQPGLNLNSFGPSSNMLNCDNDPLISGNNLGNNNNPNNNKENNNYSKSTSLPQSSSNYAFSRSDSLPCRKGVKRMFDYDNVFDSNGQSMINNVSNVVDNDHSYKKISSPLINKDVNGPTLAQLNLASIKEEEDDIINCLNAEQDGFSNVTLPRNSSLLACGNVVDLNGQQQNMISSSSSPISKSSNQKMSQNFWFQNSISTVASTSTSNTVSSTMLEDLIVPDVVDDASLEIESIFQQHQQLPANLQSQSTLSVTNNINVNRNGGQLVSNQFNLTSPPQILSSLQNFKSQLLKQKLKKPNFVAPRDQEQTKLLSELLSSKNPNLNSVLRSNPININQLNLVQRQQNSNLLRNNAIINNQRFLNNNNNLAASFNKTRGKSMLNCPTLAALITSPNPVSPMLSSAAMIPMVNNNITTGANIGTIINNNNRNRNNSMSTDYSVSSHDEGFASQPDEESEESDNDNSEEIMLVQNKADEMVDNEMFYVDNNHISSNNCSNGSLSNGSNEMMATVNISLPNLNTEVSNIIADNNNMTNCVKMEEDQIWVQNSPNMLNLSHNPLKTEAYETQYESTKESTSSMIDDNEGDGVTSDEDDDDDESFYGDYAPSDLIGATTSDDINNKWSLNMGRSRKGSEKRYFWQYNVQSKGPKGPRLGSSSSFDDEEDPHVFKEIADPVFAPDCQVEGVKHSGKARRGDGNDLTPNPKKLLMIGLELKKLSKTINDLTPVTEVPFTCRNKSRKEKNKLASRACRLKKKAQHEANKIKLYGLHREHSKFIKIINELRKVIQVGQKMKETGSKLMFVMVDDVTYQLSSPADIRPLMNQILTRYQPKMYVSGRTADFVNHILDNISAGETTGGIDSV